MNKKILVPLGQYDRSEEMIPYVENVARPGMKVVFLVRYPVDGIHLGERRIWYEGRAGGKEVGATTTPGKRTLKKRSSKLRPACEALRAKGIEAAVDVYAGSLKKAVRSHTLNGDVHLIVTRAAMDNWIGRLFDGTMSIFRSFKRPSFFSRDVDQPADARLKE